jgi:hypothetical protein
MHEIIDQAADHADHSKRVVPVHDAQVQGDPKRKPAELLLMALRTHSHTVAPGSPEQNSPAWRAVGRVTSSTHAPVSQTLKTVKALFPRTIA